MKFELLWVKEKYHGLIDQPNKWRKTCLTQRHRDKREQYQLFAL